VQLGELQSQIGRFERRGVSIVAVSVDQPHESLDLIKRLGLSFDLGSDPEQKVVNAFRVHNPDTKTLALHAVYIV
jgi:peroxiredoxin